MTFQCPDCGARIEGEARSCPVCGRAFASHKPDISRVQTDKSGETIAVCRKHWTTFIIPFIIGFLSLLAAINGFVSEDKTDMGPTYIALGVAVLCVLYIVVSYFFNYISLTSTHIIGHVGFIRSQRLTTSLSKVQGISLSNGLMGKIFRYHTITVSNAGTGGTEYIFPRMAHAKKFVSQVQKLL